MRRRQSKIFCIAYRQTNTLILYLVDVPYDDADTQLYHNEQENTEPVPHTALNQNALGKVVEQCALLEKEMRVLQTKTDKLLKIALTGAKMEQVSPFCYYINQFYSIIAHICLEKFVSY